MHKWFCTHSKTKIEYFLMKLIWAHNFLPVENERRFWKNRIFFIYSREPKILKAVFVSISSYKSNKVTISIPFAFVTSLAIHSHNIVDRMGPKYKAMPLERLYFRSVSEYMDGQKRQKTSNTQKLDYIAKIGKYTRARANTHTRTQHIHHRTAVKR